MIYLLMFLFAFNQNIDNIKYSLNSQDLASSSVIFTKTADTIDFYCSNDSYWIYYKPELKEYDNIQNGKMSLSKITYKPELITNEKTNHIKLTNLKPGTYYVSISEVSINAPIESFLPINLTNENIVQLVVRENDTYIGYMTELLGTPFILPPKLLGVYGHQTDLRIGTDCAELAIYGMRRMGYNIPYCGPAGIVKYLEPTNDLKEGTIIHFGFQVSVLYKDNGLIGQLDDQDLVIHAYLDKVSIDKLGDTGLLRNNYKLYKWKN